jgi:hypothetical protein
MGFPRRHIGETLGTCWADIQSYNIKFTMKRLREPKTP